MSDRNDGGPAYPHMMTVGHKDYAPGVTVRDAFAMHALIALYGCPPFLKGLDKAAKDAGIGFKTAMAQHAYQMADEMLAERDR